MDKRVQALWIEALESGEYVQTRGALQVAGHDWEKRAETLRMDGYGEDEIPDIIAKEQETAAPAGYCCLGVLCDIAVKDGLDLSIGTDDQDNGEEYVTYNGDTGTLPVAVVEWAGLMSHNPLVEIHEEDFEDDYIRKYKLRYDRQQGLVTLNDSFKWDFNKIAQYVRDL